MLAFIWKVAGKWIIEIGALLLALGAALLYGLEKGKKYQQATDMAKVAKTAVETANANLKATKDRQEVENEIAKTTPAAVQEVGSADPDTAAGKLADGWVQAMSAQDKS